MHTGLFARRARATSSLSRSRKARRLGRPVSGSVRASLSAPVSSSPRRALTSFRRRRSSRMRTTMAAITSSIPNREAEFHKSTRPGSPRCPQASAANQAMPAVTPATSAGPRPSHHAASSTGET